MRVLNRLSKTQGKTIVMVTHTTQSLDLCDKIIFMGKKGRLAFMGTPKKRKCSLEQRVSLRFIIS